MIDQFNKFGWVRLLENKTAATTANAFRDIIKTAGASPSTVKSDNGGEFTGGEFKALCKEFGMIHIITDTYSPQQNSISERWNKTIKTIVYKYQTQWRVQRIDEPTLQKLVTNYNNCVHGTTKQVPAKLHTAENPGFIKAAHGEIKFRAKKLLEERGPAIQFAWQGRPTVSGDAPGN